MISFFIIFFFFIIGYEMLYENYELSLDGCIPGCKEAEGRGGGEAGRKELEHVTQFLPKLELTLQNSKDHATLIVLKNPVRKIN